MVILLLLWSSPAWAAIRTLDNVPGATLLLPYFEVGVGPDGALDAAEAATTVFTVTNIDAAAQTARVTLWTDLAVPTFTFNLVLTGFDTTTVDLRLLFAGFIDGARFTNCNTPRSVLTAAEIDHLRRAHTGQPSLTWSGQCGAVDHGDRIARGFVTIDVVNQCDQAFPGSPGYFISGGSGTASNANVLTGEYTIIDRQNNFAFSETMTALEASTNPATSTSGNYTFYGRLIGWTAADNREPAAGTWFSRYLNGGLFTGGTAFLVWRDPGQVIAPFSCGAGPPAPYPLQQELLVAFDEDENPVTLDEALLPWAAMRADTRVMPIPFLFGTMFLNLNSPDAARQSFITSVFATSGRFQTAMDAFALDSAGEGQ